MIDHLLMHHFLRPLGMVITTLADTETAPPECNMAIEVGSVR